MNDETIYQIYRDVEVGDIVHRSYASDRVTVKSISTPKYVLDYRYSGIFIFDYPRFHIRLNPSGNITEICYDPELDCYRSSRNIYRFEKPEHRPKLKVDMFRSYLSPADDPYSFQDDVDYQDFYILRCKLCNLDFNFTPQGKFQKFANCPCCGKWTNRRVFYMDSDLLKYTNTFIAGLGGTPESIKFARTSEHELLRDEVLSCLS